MWRNFQSCLSRYFLRSRSSQLQVNVKNHKAANLINVNDLELKRIMSAKPTNKYMDIDEQFR